MLWGVDWANEADGHHKLLILIGERSEGGFKAHYSRGNEVKFFFPFFYSDGFTSFQKHNLFFVFLLELSKKMLTFFEFSLFEERSQFSFIDVRH